MYKKEFMELAVKEARRGILNGDGGPFGAVIVKNGEIVASGHNGGKRKITEGIFGRTGSGNVFGTF